MVLWFALTVHASPSFEGDSADRALAAEMWELAEACTGRASDVQQVTLKKGPIEERIDHGEIRIEGRRAVFHLPEVEFPVVGLPNKDHMIGIWNVRLVAHAVGHAWVREGPDTLVEGAVELLADCIVDRHPDWDVASRFRTTPYVLSRSVDPRTWTAQRTSVYGAVGFGPAHAWMREFAKVVPAERLYVRQPSWKAVEADLRADGVRGTWLWEQFATDPHGVIEREWEEDAGLLERLEAADPNL